jgi:DNA-binding beta-propeller fold protein YncE
MRRCCRRARWLTGLCALALGTAGATSAQAHIAHEKISEFSSVGGTPTGVVIDQSNQDIYVGSNAASAVFKFNPKGEPINGGGEPSQSPLVSEVGGHLNIAVDNSGGVSAHDLYVPDGGGHAVKKYQANGEFVCTLNRSEPACKGQSPVAFGEGEDPEAVAVDPSTGVVYVSDKTNNVIDVFSPTGEYLTQITAASGQPLQNPRDLKVDSSGDVFVASEGAGVPFAVMKFKPSSEPATSSTTWGESVFNASESATAIAIDAANNVYIGLGSGSVTKYDPAGAVLSSFEGGGLAFGIAVNDTTGNIYLGLLGGGVAVFNTFNAATVTTGAASEVKHTSAKVEGTVNPEGLTVTNCFFSYGAKTTPCNLSGAEIGTGNAPVSVSAELTGLEPGAKYPFQLVVEVEGHEDKGAQAEFEAVPVATVTTEAATNVLPESVTLNGTLTPLVSGEVEYFIEYGTEEPFSTTAVHKQPGVEGEPIKAQEAVTGLTPAVTATTYKDRLVAVVEGHTVKGELQSFETPPVATATSEPASTIGSAAATVNAKVNVLAGSAGYYFEYFQIEGEEPAKTPEQSLGLGEHSVAAELTGLIPNVAYHFRVVVTPSNPKTPIQGALLEFRTSVAAAAITGEAASGVQRHSAVLGGDVNPGHGETTYYFEYATAHALGETGAYSAVTSAATITAEAAGVIPIPTGPVALAELAPGTVYHYRLTATNAAGTTHGPDMTFNTLAPIIPSVSGESAQVTSPSTATVSGVLNTQGLAGTYALEIGPDTSYGTPLYGPIRGGEGPTSPAFALTGLLPGTTYHYRLTATDEDGTVHGADHSFTTPGFPSSITEPPAPVIIPFTAPVEHPSGGGPVKPPTRAQQLAKALKACAKKPKRQRAACIKQAHRRYGPVKKTKH